MADIARLGATILLNVGPLDQGLTQGQAKLTQFGGAVAATNSRMAATSGRAAAGLSEVTAETNRLAAANRSLLQAEINLDVGISRRGLKNSVKAANAAGHAISLLGVEENTAASHAF